MKTIIDMAREALELYVNMNTIDESYLLEVDIAPKAITALREALAEQPAQQEPVAVVSGYYGGQCVILPINPARIFNSNTALYTTPQPPAQQEPVAWRDHVEQRLLTWRQSFVNKSGDQLALDDFMDKRSLDDLIDFVCDEYTRPQAREPLTDEQEREAFEAHWYSFYHSGSIHARSDGSYFHPHVQRAWEAWQARAAQE